MNKIELNEIINKIKNLKNDSNELFEIHEVVNEKYFTFEKPDDFQTCLKALNAILNKSDPEEVMVAIKIFIQIFEMKQNNLPSAIINLGFKNGIDYVVEIFKDGLARDSLCDAIKKVSSGAKPIKNKYGKSYFNKKERSKE